MSMTSAEAELYILTKMEESQATSDEGRLANLWRIAQDATDPVLARAAENKAAALQRDMEAKAYLAYMVKKATEMDKQVTDLTKREMLEIKVAFDNR